MNGVPGSCPSSPSPSTRAAEFDGGVAASAGPGCMNKTRRGRRSAKSTPCLILLRIRRCPCRCRQPVLDPMLLLLFDDCVPSSGGSTGRVSLPRLLPIPGGRRTDAEGLGSATALVCYVFCKRRKLNERSRWDQGTNEAKEAAINQSIDIDRHGDRRKPRALDGAGQVQSPLRSTSIDRSMGTLIWHAFKQPKSPKPKLRLRR